MTPSLPYAEVIGDPVDQSRSPEIHQYWMESLGLAGAYRATRVGRGELGAYLADRRADPDWRGCNVTMPLKLDALLEADSSSDRAAAAGAANLLTRRADKLVAANTDVGGIHDLVAPLDRGSVTVLGTGGAARAVLVALKLLGAGEIRLQARNMAEASALCVEFGLHSAPRAFDAPVDSVGLINATPVGMRGVVPVQFDIAAMPVGGWVFDLVSAPLPTPLLARAADRRLTTIDGLALLVEQAADSFELLFGSKPPRERDRDLLARLRA